MQRSVKMQTSGEPARAVRTMCRLSDDQLATRLAEVRPDIITHIRKVHNLQNGFLLEFNDTLNVKAKVERLGALEQGSCAGLRFELREKAQPEGLNLMIRGINPKAEAFEQMFAAIESSPIWPGGTSHYCSLLELWFSGRQPGAG